MFDCMKDVNERHAPSHMKFVVSHINYLPQDLATLIARFPKDYSVEIKA